MLGSIVTLSSIIEEHKLLPFIEFDKVIWTNCVVVFDLCFLFPLLPAESDADKSICYVMGRNASPLTLYKTFRETKTKKKLPQFSISLFQMELKR